MPRTALGLLVAAVLLPVLTVVLVQLRSSVTLGTVLLLYLVAVVVVAVAGSVLAAVVAALVSDLVVNFWFTEPLHTLAVHDQDTVVDLVVFVAVAVTVSVTVDLAIRSREAAARSRSEAELLARLAARPVADASLIGVLEEVRTTFAMRSVSLVQDVGPDEVTALSTVGEPGGEVVLDVEAAPGLRLEASGPHLFAEDRRVLTRLATAAARAWETEQLGEQARRAEVLADVDRLRTALLAAVGHDLRTPLAGIKASVTALRQDDLPLGEADRAELLATIDESADDLEDLIANLLAMSRLTVGALSVHTDAVRLDAVVASVAGSAAGPVRVDVPDDLPSVRADAGLLERVLANLLSNALRFAPPGSEIAVTGVPSADTVVLAVADHGPGVPAEDRDTMFAPFQRLDDTSGDGLGLGLAIARGFTEAMGGRLEPGTTPGGGLTMLLTLPAVP